jgi:hypothetical protein
VDVLRVSQADHRFRRPDGEVQVEALKAIARLVDDADRAAPAPCPNGSRTRRSGQLHAGTFPYSPCQ